MARIGRTHQTCAHVDPADAIAPWPRVLLVEDDQANRKRISAILAEQGVTVIGEASDGASGVRLARELEPDVVLMDMRMPFMGGLEATRAIKEKLPLTQVIILTSYEGPLPSRSAEQAGAYAYLVKGCSAQLLREMIYQAWKYRVGLQRADEEQTADGLTSMLSGEDESQASFDAAADPPDRKSTRLNSSHGYISYAVFCLKKKNIRCRELGAEVIAG